MSASEERIFCLMSIDMAGHTGLTLNLPHRTTYELFSAYHTWIESAVTAEEGEVWSWAGDGALCAFGSGSTDMSGNAQMCVRAALTLLDSLEQFNSQHEVTKKSPIRVRLACHIGPVLDVPQRGKIFSDAINIVVHLEKQGTFDNSLTVTRDVYRELPDAVRRRFNKGRKFAGLETFTTADLKRREQWDSIESAKFREAAKPPERPMGKPAAVFSCKNSKCVYFLRELKAGDSLADLITGYEVYNDGPLVSSNDLIAFWNASAVFDYRVLEPGIYTRSYTRARGNDIVSLGYNAVTQEILESLKTRTQSQRWEPGCGFFYADNTRPRRYMYSYVTKHGILESKIVAPVQPWVEGTWGLAIFQRLRVDNCDVWLLFGNRGITTMLLGKAVGEYLGKKLRGRFGDSPFASIYRLEFGQQPEALWFTGQSEAKLRRILFRKWS